MPELARIFSCEIIVFPVILSCCALIFFSRWKQQNLNARSAVCGFKTLKSGIEGPCFSDQTFSQFALMLYLLIFCLTFISLLYLFLALFGYLFFFSIVEKGLWDLVFDLVGANQLLFLSFVDVETFSTREQRGHPEM